MLALEGGQVILNLVILRVFEADIIIDTSSFLAIPNDKLAKTFMPTWEFSAKPSSLPSGEDRSIPPEAYQPDT